MKEETLQVSSPPTIPFFTCKLPAKMTDFRSSTHFKLVTFCDKKHFSCLEKCNNKKVK